MTENTESVAPEITPTESTSASPEIPKDLQDLWGSVQALALSFRVIKEASHQQANFKAVDNSLIFLKDLHDQAYDSCLAHKYSESIPEIKQIKDQLDSIKAAQEKRDRKAKKNGKEDSKH